jgi:DNA-binding GntR family transcriptional regulator
VIIEALEVLALEQAFPRLTRDDVQGLQDANLAMQQAAIQEKPIMVVITDENFHELLIRHANNGELKILLSQLKTRLRRIELAYFDAAPLAQASFREHAAIINALQKRTLSAASAALRLNWRGSLERLRTMVKDRASENCDDP